MIITKFDGLLPSDAITIEASSASVWESGLLAQEADCVQHAVPKRKREFTAGRNCARQALQRLGYKPIPILVGNQRAPVFPRDVSGTITHAQGYCAAAVIRKAQTLSIGIDAEINGPLGADVISHVLRPEEQAMTKALPPSTSIYWDKLIFSMKESFYKAFFQVCPMYLDFLEACVEICPAECSFRIRVLRSDVDEYFRGVAFRGRYGFDSKLVYCAIALPSRDANIVYPPRGCRDSGSS